MLGPRLQISWKVLALGPSFEPPSPGREMSNFISKWGGVLGDPQIASLFVFEYGFIYFMSDVVEITFELLFICGKIYSYINIIRGLFTSSSLYSTAVLSGARMRFSLNIENFVLSISTTRCHCLQKFGTRSINCRPYLDSDINAIWCVQILYQILKEQFKYLWARNTAL